MTEIATNAFSYPAKTTMRGLKGSYAETYANDRGMTFETITSVYASMLTVKFKNDYDGYEAAPSYTYTGKPFKPDVKVYLGSYELTAGTDYKIVSYKNNTKSVRLPALYRVLAHIREQQPEALRLHLYRYPVIRGIILSNIVIMTTPVRK